MFRTNLRIVTAMVSVLVAAASSQAQVVPPGLQPGDPYYLVFRTDASRNALSSNIADYNQFVNLEAAQNPFLTGTDNGVQWFAIASTETVNARDNALVGFGVPVFLLDGTTKVVDGFADMWDGTIDAPINLNQFLAPVGGSVWTGSTISGGSHPGRSLGQSPNSILGSASATSGLWISNLLLDSAGLHPLYALSEELTVAALCPTDVNGDGVTNVVDLIDLLQCFGQPAVPGCQSEDTNGDSTVNVLDLIDLLLAFGTACP